MKIEIIKDVRFNNDKIPTIKQGEVFTLPHKQITDDYCLVMEYQDRSFFFDSYISLYYILGEDTFGVPLEAGKHYKIIEKQRGKISKLTQTEFELEEPQKLLF
jgi:hypothetical protein